MDDDVTPVMSPVAMELQRARVEQARRRLLAGALSPQVLDAIAELLGVREQLFSFEAREDGSFDTLRAMRVDTLRGVVETLRYEVARVEQCERNLREMEILLQK